MNNYEFIKQMDINEMANVIYSFQASSFIMQHVLTESEIKEWLLKEDLYEREQRNKG
jgi:hypothetical protein